jgi:acetolactate synthase-1/2/3 large subunit
MPIEQYTVGDPVADFLSRIGGAACFGIVSVHNVPMLDAIGRRNDIPHSAPSRFAPYNAMGSYARA